MTMMKLTALVVVVPLSWLITSSSAQYEPTSVPTSILSQPVFSYLPTSFPTPGIGSEEVTSSRQNLTNTPTSLPSGFSSSTPTTPSRVPTTNSSSPPTLAPSVFATTASPTPSPSTSDASSEPTSPPLATPTTLPTTGSVVTSEPSIAPLATPTSSDVLEVSSGFDLSQVTLANAEEYRFSVLAVAIAAIGGVPSADIDVDVSSSSSSTAESVAVEYEIETKSASAVEDRLKSATEEDFEREIKSAATGLTSGFDDVIVSSLREVDVDDGEEEGPSKKKKKNDDGALTPTLVAVIFFSCLICVLAIIVCCVRQRHRRDTWGMWPDEAVFDNVVELPPKENSSATPPRYLHDRDDNDDDFVSQEPSYI